MTEKNKTIEHPEDLTSNNYEKKTPETEKSSQEKLSHGESELEATIPSDEEKVETLDFIKLGVSHFLTDVLEKKGWTNPTEIQEKALPISLKGRDLAGFAQTGTGKTGVFLITFAESLLSDKTHKTQKSKLPKALVICPTRELALQIEDEAINLLATLEVKTLALYGGTSLEPQIRSLQKGVDLVVATPGRLLDLCEQKFLKLDKIKFFVCDEVDRMFDMGFTSDVELIISKIPETAQKLAFSATLNERSKELCSKHLKDPSFISVNNLVITPESIKQNAIICQNQDKIKLLLSLLKQHEPDCAIIFTNTKLVASWLLFKLEKNNLNVQMISGDLPQNKRTKLIKQIKQGDIKILIATDVASRGLHIPNVSHVYNFDLPDDPANYVHRIGRTARAGAEGESHSFICEDYGQNFEAIQKLLGEKTPKPSYLKPEDIENVEDLAKNPFGKKSARTYEKTAANTYSRSPKKHFERKDFSKSSTTKKYVGKTSSRYEKTTPSRNNKTQRPYSGRNSSKKYSYHKKKQTKTFSGMIKKVFSFVFKSK